MTFEFPSEVEDWINAEPETGIDYLPIAPLYSKRETAEQIATEAGRKELAAIYPIWNALETHGREYQDWRGTRHNVAPARGELEKLRARLTEARSAVAGLLSSPAIASPQWSEDADHLPRRLVESTSEAVFMRMVGKLQPRQKLADISAIHSSERIQAFDDGSGGLLNPTLERLAEQLDWYVEVTKTSLDRLPAKRAGRPPQSALKFWVRSVAHAWERHTGNPITVDQSMPSGGSKASYFLSWALRQIDPSAEASLPNALASYRTEKNTAQKT